jgi:hypothetical protein
MGHKDIAEVEFQNKLLIVKKKAFNSVINAEDIRKRLFFATGGFGCSPHLRGSRVAGFFMSNADDAGLERGDFEAVVDITPELQVRIDECKEHIEFKNNHCHNCGKDLTGDTSKYFDMLGACCPTDCLKEKEEEKKDAIAKVLDLWDRGCAGINQPQSFHDAIERLRKAVQ